MCFINTLTLYGRNGAVDWKYCISTSSTDFFSDTTCTWVPVGYCCFHLGWSQNIAIQERAKRQCPFSITIRQRRRLWQPQILCWSGGPRHLRDIFIPLSQARLSRQNQFNWLKACLLACLVGHFFVLTITMWCHVYCTLIPVYMSTVEPRCNQCNVVHRVHGKDHIFSWNVLFQYRLHALCNA